MRTFDQPLGETGGPTALVQVEPGAETAALPDPAFLAGEFARNGSDLMLESPDGDSLVLRDYFANETLPDLAVGEARLSGPTVETLAGPLAPAQVAQTGPDAGGDAIGEITELTGSATVVRTSGATESLSLGDPIFLGDTLRTGAGSSVGVTFIDDTLFSLSEDARLVIDQLIFNPGGGGNELSLSLLQGAASFLAGQIAPSDGAGMKVTTPVATIGVRGTQVVMFYDAVEQILEAVLVEDLDGGIGSATIFNNVSSQAISALREGVVVTGLDQPIGPPELVAPNALLAAKFALAVQSLINNYGTFLQNVAPEAGPPPNDDDGGNGGGSGDGGGSGGVGILEPPEGSEVNLFLEGPDSEIFELEVLLLEIYSFFFFVLEDPNLIDLFIELVEILLEAANEAPDLDLDADGSSGAVDPESTIDATGFEIAFGKKNRNSMEGIDPAPAPVPVVDDDVEISDPDSMIASAMVTLTNAPDGAAEGLRIDTDALARIASGAITVAASSTATRLVLEGVAEAADYQAALRLVRYDNSSEDRDATDRLVEIKVTDEDGADSNTAITRISVEPAREVPVINSEEEAVQIPSSTGFEVGQDTLGKSSADTQTGGSGNDIFRYKAGDGGSTLALADLITDFEDGFDKIGLGSNLTFGTGPGEVRFLAADDSSFGLSGSSADSVLAITDGDARVTKFLAVIKDVTVDSLDATDTTILA